jgi:hypothetical protein
MNRVRIVLTGAVLLSMVSIVVAQIKTVPGETKLIKGTVESIDVAQRVLTVKDSKGKFETIDVPAGTERFSQVKVGDIVSVRYFDNVTVRLKEPGEPAVNTFSGAATPVAGDKPAGTIAKQRTLTATIQEIDPKVPSITFTAPNGWKYSRRVDDKKVLQKVKVGDRVDFTWTEAVMVDIQPAKK